VILCVRAKEEGESHEAFIFFGHEFDPNQVSQEGAVSVDEFKRLTYEHYFGVGEPEGIEEKVEDPIDLSDEFMNYLD